MKTNFQWTKDQEKVLSIIQDWWNSTLRNPTLCVSGAAGTGKSTLLASLPLILKRNKKSLDIAFATLTAKAALVLRNKGVNASTIHSLIYDTKMFEDPITHRIKYIFNKKTILGKDLIIIDEASMVSDVLYDDLKSFGIPIIFMGDNFQLPPINSELNLMDDNFICYCMKDIVRQQQDNMIIKMSVKLRNFENIPYMNNEQFTKIHHSRFKIQDLLNYDQIITGKNITRIDLNKQCRKLLGRISDVPTIGDKMVFLKNNYEDNVFNGEQIVLTSEPKVLGKGKYQIQGQDIVTQDFINVNIVDDFINQIPVNIEQKRYNKIQKSDYNQIDYGNALSVHKSQGSQWDSVLLWDDLFAINRQQQRNRWLYTAITRASKKVIWIA